MLISRNAQIGDETLNGNRRALILQQSEHRSAIGLIGSSTDGHDLANARKDAAVEQLKLAIGIANERKVRDYLCRQIVAGLAALASDARRLASACVTAALSASYRRTGIVACPKRD